MNLHDKIKETKPDDWIAKGIDPAEVKSIMINSRIARHVQLTRQGMGLSRDDLSEMLGVSKYQIAKWEDTNHEFTISDICKVCQAIDITDYLMKIISNNKNENKEETKNE